MNFSSIIDVLGRPSSSPSFLDLEKGCSIVAFFRLKKNRFVVAFLSLEKGHYVATFLDSSMPSTSTIMFSNPRTLLSFFVVIIICPTSLLVVDSSFDVVQDFILC
jgi:hypothetical protein